MPIKGKGKKKKKTAKVSANTKAAAEKPISILKNIEVAPPPTRLDTLKAILAENKVDEKFVSGTTVPSHCLKSLTPNEIGQLKYVFDTLDFNNSGWIGGREFRRALKALGFKVNQNEVDAIVKDLPNRRVSFIDFMDVIISRQADSIDAHDELNHNFQLFDINNEGGISKEAIKSLCLEVGLSLTDQEIHDMMIIADKNGDRFIQQNEFVEVMMRTNIFEDIDLMRMSQMYK